MTHINWMSQNSSCLNKSLLSNEDLSKFKPLETLFKQEFFNTVQIHNQTENTLPKQSLNSEQHISDEDILSIKFSESINIYRDS